MNCFAMLEIALQNAYECKMVLDFTITECSV